MQQIAVLGGSGFVGRHLVRRLLQDKYALRIPSRQAENASALASLPGVEVIQADVHNPDQLKRVLNGCTAVINLIGILNEPQHNGEGFYHAHVEIVEKLLKACDELGIQRILHMSALHAQADTGPSFYLRSKGMAEQRLLAATDKHITFFRPSVIFGPDDSFFQRFAGLLRLVPPFMPMFLPGKDARFAPVFVGDVVEVMAQSLNDPQTYGAAYNLCGPKAYTLGELVTYVGEVSGRKHPVWPMPGAYALAWFMEKLPGQPLSRDNLDSMKLDSVCHENGFAAFHLTPQAIEDLVPTYFQD